MWLIRKTGNHYDSGNYDDWFAGVSLNPAMATNVTRAGGRGTLVATVHTSIINLGIVLGSSIGGLTIDAGYGLASPLWVGRTIGNDWFNFFTTSFSW